MIPNFLVIGAQKSGTTWLYRHFWQHPEIFVSEEKWGKKEIHYFDREFHRGIGWYLEHFKGADSYKAIGEVTPSYLYFPQCAERIYNLLPNVNLIAVLRNPVYRAFSQYKMVLRKQGCDPGKLPLQKACMQFPAILHRGMYADQLKRYFNLFGKKQFLILFYDDLVKSPDNFLTQVFEFLDVQKMDTNYLLSNDSIKQNNVSSVSAYPRIVQIFARLIRLCRLLSKNDNNITQRFLINFRQMVIDAKRVRLNMELQYLDYKYLKGYFSDEIDRLETLLDKDLSFWKN